MRYASYFALYFIVTKHITKGSQVKVLLYALCISTAITVVYGLCQRLGYDFALWDIQGRIFSTFGHPNFFADYLIIVIPTFVGVFITLATPQRGRKLTKSRHLFLFLSLLLILLAILCLLFTLSRGAWIGLAMAFPFFVVLVLKYLKKEILKNQKFWLGALAMAVFLALALVAFFDTTLQRRAKSSVELKTEVTGSNEARLVIWEGSLNMFFAKPMQGWGLGTFQIFFPQFRPSDYVRKGVSHNALHAHSEYLEVASEMGIVGLIAFLFLLLSYFYLNIRTMKILKDDYYTPLIIGLLTGVFAALGQNALCVSLRWTPAAVPFWFAFAFTVAIIKIRVAHQQQGITKIATEQRKFQSHLTPANRPKELGMPGKMTGYFLLSILGFSLLLLIVCDFISGVYLAKTEEALANKQLKTAAEMAFYSQKFHPYNLEAYYKLAYAYGQLGNVDAAIKIYQRLSQLAPNFAQIHYNLAGAYKVLKQYDNALSEASQAVTQNDSALTHFLLATLFFETKRWEMAQKEYKRVRELKEGLLLRQRIENPYLSFRFKQESDEQLSAVQEAEIVALYNLGEAYENLKQLHKAKDYYSQFLKEYPSNKLAESAKKRIAFLSTNTGTLFSQW